MDASLVKARMAIERFERTLSEVQRFDENLAFEYNRLRRSLAASFQTMSMADVPRTTFRLEDVKGAVSAEMRRLFEGRVDSSLFQIRRYTTPHPDIYAVLASRVGEDVPAWRIRLLSGDATHTERRTRELRDLGLRIAVVEDDEDSYYRLESGEPDLAYAAAFQLRENASRSRRLSSSARSDIIMQAELVVDLPERKTQRA